MTANGIVPGDEKVLEIRDFQFQIIPWSEKFPGTLRIFFGSS